MKIAKNYKKKEGKRTSSAITPIRQKLKRKIIRQWGNKPIARKRKRRESRKRIKGKRKNRESLSAMNQRRITAKRAKCNLDRPDILRRQRANKRENKAKTNWRMAKINLRKTADKTASAPRTKATEKRQTKAAAKSGIRLREPL